MRSKYQVACVVVNVQEEQMIVLPPPCESILLDIILLTPGWGVFLARGGAGGVRASVRLCVFFHQGS